ncbi:MAG: lipid-A-disaccharide synthase [Bacteroidia bacterium]|nr:lipid-A-disaccharide synthase [Bacteroidia bacterium]
MKYYVIAGEASGDLHASNLIQEIKEFDPSSEFRGWGGDLMISKNVNVVKHIKELAFLGITEVIANIRTIKKNFKFCEQDIVSYSPDVLILVDYPGFNLRIAKFAKSKGFKIFYYISPTVWAWHQSRVEQVRKYVDKMFTILPFEKEFYKKFNIDVEFVGHPLLDAIANEQKNIPPFNEFCIQNKLSGKPIIAILPGSRKQEIKKKLPLMLKIVEYFNDFQFVIAGAPSISVDFYNQYMDNQKVPIVFGKTYQILKNAQSAIVTSGTATLETALFNIPQVVCYKTSPLTYIIAKLFVSIKHISLVNIILNKESITELIQGKLTVNNLKNELTLITTGEKREQILSDYELLSKLIGEPGASKRIAKIMVELLKSK